MLFFVFQSVTENLPEVPTEPLPEVPTKEPGMYTNQHLQYSNFS